MSNMFAMHLSAARCNVAASWSAVLPRCHHQHMRPPFTAATLRGRSQWQVRADQHEGDTESESAEEARLEALEGGVKRKRSAQALQKQMRKTALQQAASRSGRAEWKEGKLLPEGWEDMDTGRKLSELYIGERGLLFWATKATWAAIFLLLGVWVVFRLILPALGVYTLTNDLTAPPTL